MRMDDDLTHLKDRMMFVSNDIQEMKELVMKMASAPMSKKASIAPVKPSS